MGVVALSAPSIHLIDLLSLGHLCLGGERDQSTANLGADATAAATAACGVFAAGGGFLAVGAAPGVDLAAAANDAGSGVCCCLLFGSGIAGSLGVDDELAETTNSVPTTRILLEDVCCWGDIAFSFAGADTRAALSFGPADEARGDFKAMPSSSPGRVVTETSPFASLLLRVECLASRHRRCQDQALAAKGSGDTFRCSRWSIFEVEVSLPS